MVKAFDVKNPNAPFWKIRTPLIEDIDRRLFLGAIHSSDTLEEAAAKLGLSYACFYNRAKRVRINLKEEIKRNCPL